MFQSPGTNILLLFALGLLLVALAPLIAVIILFAANVLPFAKVMQSEAASFLIAMPIVIWMISWAYALKHVKSKLHPIKQS